MLKGVCFPETLLSFLEEKESREKAFKSWSETQEPANSVSETHFFPPVLPLVRALRIVYFFCYILIQGVAPPADPPKPIFQLIPDRMVLHPGESQEVQLKGYSET